ncbi:MAG: ABC transporter ATP-binding protein [Candidatus Geothermarchaeales archaeon]
MTDAIALKGIGKVYGTGRIAVKALRDVNLHVGLGEVAAIMGPSGSGKTTLLMICGGLLKPTEGDVVVNGSNITESTQKELNSFRLKTVGFVFQDFHLLSALTAQENVEIALDLAGVGSPRSKERAKDLLVSLGLEKRLSFLPKNLSGGEKQRVAIARALANDPKIVLADEPTGNLDSKTGSEVARLLHDTAKDQDRTVVIATHDARILSQADHVFTLEDGRIVSD